MTHRFLCWILHLSVPLLVGWAAFLVVEDGAVEWYATLRKPFFAPMAWVFCVGWIVSYLLVGLGSGRIHRQMEDVSEFMRSLPVMAYAIHLALSFTSIVVFFGFRDLTMAFIVCLFLLISTGAVAWLFDREIRGAGRWLLPSILWVAYWTVLIGALSWVNTF